MIVHVKLNAVVQSTPLNPISFIQIQSHNYIVMSHVCQNGCSARIETGLKNGRKREACDDISSSTKQQFQPTQQTRYSALER